MNIIDTSNQDTEIHGKPKKTMIMGVLMIVFITLVVITVIYLSPLMHSVSSFERSRFRFSKVELGVLQSELSVEGKLIASSYPTLFTPSSGRIRLFVQPGDQVQENQTLAMIDSPELDNKLLQELALYDQLTTAFRRKKMDTQKQDTMNQQTCDLKQLQNATALRELKRSESLYEEGLIHKLELDSARDRAQVSTLEFNHAKKAVILEKDIQKLDVENMEKKLERQAYIVKEARRKVEELNIRAPFNGIVGSLEVNRADVLSSNQPILTLIDPTAFEIQIQVPENMGDDIAAGLPAEIRYEGNIYSGRVSSIAPEVIDSIVMGRVEFTNSYPDSMKQNKRVSVKIIQARKTHVLKVRKGPFIESGFGRTAYVLNDSFALKRNIRIGSKSLTEVEIIEGLQEGETIIISDLSRFADAEKVFLRN